MKLEDADKPIGTLVEGVEDAVSGYLCQEHAFRTATQSQVPINITPGQWEMMGEIHGFSAEIARPIVGFIDLYDPATRSLIDLKTSSAKRTSWTWAMQVIIYAMAKQANSARIHLMTRTATAKYYDFLVPVNKTNIKWAMQAFTHHANMIEQWLADGAGDHLPRTPDYWCGWCPAKMDCPAQAVILGGN